MTGQHLNTASPKLFALQCSAVLNKPKLKSLPCSLLSFKHSQHVDSSSGLHLLLAGRRGPAGSSPQPAPDHRGPASLHLFRPRPQHPVCQFLSTTGPRRLPVEPGGQRGGVRFLRHIRSRRSVEELRFRRQSREGIVGRIRGGIFNGMPSQGRKYYTMKPSIFVIAMPVSKEELFPLCSFWSSKNHLYKWL